ncbi:hypothetical protein VSX44_02585 [Citrobacter freundii]|uniref:hypothetical protein n=1 Tax=Citrobacter freundii TaxID=546 RepID=UPI00300C9321
MSLSFFSSHGISSLIQTYREEISQREPENEFGKERNDLLIEIFESFEKYPSRWDERCQYSIDKYQSELLSMIQDASTVPVLLNNTFATCYMFAIESDMLDDGWVTVTDNFKYFCTYKIDGFDEKTKRRILFATREIPVRIVKKFIFTQEISTYRDFVDMVNKSKKIEEEWDKKASEKEARIQKLNDALRKQESDFNFSALFDGFFRLGEIKKNELKWARNILFLFGTLIPLPLAWEWFHIGNNDFTELKDFAKIIPVASITIILIYYFKIALGNFNSVKAQVIQIELRKSLCCFIQSYAEYAKEIKENSETTLVKFEEIIFSNIMLTENKIPSTFDGIDQVATLISSIRNGKS